MKKILSFLIFFVPTIGFCSSSNEPALTLIWASPFFLLLLSIAVFPMFFPKFWEKRMGLVTALLIASLLIPFTIHFSFLKTIHLVLEAFFVDYLPFIALLFSLYCVSGGILVAGNLTGTPRFNTGLLAIGAFAASIMGTTGASMLLIRPIIRANKDRKYKTHIVVFFIFLVSNIGGGLTPIGDPPLFLGFLHGVPFLWTVEHMLAPVAFMVSILLFMFFCIDSYHFHREKKFTNFFKKKRLYVTIQGWFNVLLLFFIVTIVIISGVWESKIHFTLLGIHLKIQDLLREFLLFVIAGISLKFTRKKIRHRNHFHWHPIVEVAKLFIGIFITITPLISLLYMGEKGPLKPLFQTIFDANGQPIPHLYFWFSGILSSFLDNAPTYLVFFNIASGGDVQQLLGPMHTTLLAISVGSVFMGASTYIGNAPNFMIKAIADDDGIHMPSFFGYFMRSLLLLFPLFYLISLIFFS